LAFPWEGLFVRSGEAALRRRHLQPPRAPDVARTRWKKRIPAFSSGRGDGGGARADAIAVDSFTLAEYAGRIGDHDAACDVVEAR
jgi:hypothetical protein